MYIETIRGNKNTGTGSLLSGILTGVIKTLVHWAALTVNPYARETFCTMYHFYADYLRGYCWLSGIATVSTGTVDRVLDCTQTIPPFETTRDSIEMCDDFIPSAFFNAHLLEVITCMCYFQKIHLFLWYIKVFIWRDQKESLFFRNVKALFHISSRIAMCSVMINFRVPVNGGPHLRTRMHIGCLLHSCNTTPFTWHIAHWWTALVHLNSISKRFQKHLFWFQSVFVYST